MAGNLAAVAVYPATCIPPLPGLPRHVHRQHGKGACGVDSGGNKLVRLKGCEHLGHDVCHTNMPFYLAAGPVIEAGGLWDKLRAAAAWPEASSSTEATIASVWEQCGLILSSLGIGNAHKTR